MFEDISETIQVRNAHDGDIVACKSIADRQRDILGFMLRAVFADAVQRGQLLVAEGDREIYGFVRFNHRTRGSETAIYDICVDASMQRRGIGRLLVEAIVTDSQSHRREAIVLRCPEGVTANGFYDRLGFQQIRVEQGRRRRLVVWRLPFREA